MTDTVTQADRLKAAYERGYRDGSNGLPPLSDPRFADGGAATPMRETGTASSVGAGALAHLESEARRFAGFYEPNSDMANTLNILGNKIAALAAISTAQVDETERVTVPREPTEAMYLAAFNSDLWGGRQPIRRVVDEIWDAMLRAALAPEGDAR